MGQIISHITSYFRFSSLLAEQDVFVWFIFVLFFSTKCMKVCGSDLCICLQ